MGRQAIDRELLLYAIMIRAYCGATTRKAIDPISAAVGDARWEQDSFHFNRLSEALNESETTAALNRAIAEVCSPFAAFSEDVILDGTGIALTPRGLYRSERYPEYERPGRSYARLSLVMDRFSKTFPGAVVTPDHGKGTGELTQAPELLRGVKANGWEFRRVLADGLYAAEPFFELVVDEYGAEPVVPLRRIYSEKRLPKTPLMLRLYRQFEADRPGFEEVYRMRPLVESGISALKRKFVGSVRSRTVRAQMNEILLKVLCHNIDCVVHAASLFGISIETMVQMMH